MKLTIEMAPSQRGNLFYRAICVLQENSGTGFSGEGDIGQAIFFIFSDFF